MIKIQCKKCGDIIESNYIQDAIECKCNSTGVEGSDIHTEFIGDIKNIKIIEKKKTTSLYKHNPIEVEVIQYTGTKESMENVKKFLEGNGLGGSIIKLEEVERSVFYVKMLIYDFEIGEDIIEFYFCNGFYLVRCPTGMIYAYSEEKFNYYYRKN